MWSARPREEPGDHEHEIAAARGLQHGGADQRGVVGPWRQALAERAAAARERLQHRAVGIGDLAGSEGRARRAQLAARRQDRDERPAHHVQLAVAGDGGERDVVGREQAAGRQQLVALLHVLARGAHVRAALDGALDEQAHRALAGDLDLRDGIEAVVDRLARVDAQVGAGRERAVAGLRGDHGVAVHRGAAVRRVRRERDQRPGKHPAGGFLERHALGTAAARSTPRPPARRARPRRRRPAPLRAASCGLRERSARPRRRR